MVFELDTSDMDRHVVELRLFCEKAKRRFTKAQMADKYENIIRNTLPQITEGEENSIRIDRVDKQEARRLNNFLVTLIDKCSHVEQHEAIQSALRESLQQSRRKSIIDPQSGNQIEPMCLFCAGNIHADRCFMQSTFNGPEEPPGRLTTQGGSLPDSPVSPEDIFIPPVVELVEEHQPPHDEQQQNTNTEPINVTPPQSTGGPTPEIPLTTGSSTPPLPQTDITSEALQMDCEARETAASTPDLSSNQADLSSSGAPSSSKQSQAAKTFDHDDYTSRDHSPATSNSNASSQDQNGNPPQSPPILEDCNQSTPLREDATQEHLEEQVQSDTNNNADRDVVSEGQSITLNLRPTASSNEPDLNAHEDSLHEWFEDAATERANSTPIKRPSAPSGGDRSFSDDEETDIDDEEEEQKERKDKKRVKLSEPLKKPIIKDRPLSLVLIKPNNQQPHGSSKQFRTIRISPSKGLSAGAAIISSFSQNASTSGPRIGRPPMNGSAQSNGLFIEHSLSESLRSTSPVNVMTTRDGLNSQPVVSTSFGPAKVGRPSINGYTRDSMTTLKRTLLISPVKNIERNPVPRASQSIAVERETRSKSKPSSSRCVAYTGNKSNNNGNSNSQQTPINTNKTKQVTFSQQMDPETNGAGKRAKGRPRTKSTPKRR